MVWHQMDSTDGHARMNAYEHFLRIVDPATSGDMRTLAMRGFAENLAWTPSYEFKASFGIDAVSDHLVVEHGLENAAIISFVKSPRRASELSASETRALLSISYNNLVDWHFFVSETDIRRINNLSELSKTSLADQTYPLLKGEFEQRLSSEELGRLSESRDIRTTLKACDDAFLQVLARWKRLLNADYPSATNENLSALFNALIFVRGCEDRNLDQPISLSRGLLKRARQILEPQTDAASLVELALRDAGVSKELSAYVNVSLLSPFKQMDTSTIQNLCRDFYAPSDATYDFNFALMSKHALSRIYERYVSLFRPEPEISEQLSFISPTTADYIPRKTGAIYTPQFIAGFFARYLQENTTPRKFRSLRAIDPACGSGIFLRTILEFLCNPMIPGTTHATIRDAFQRVEGWDKDPNAIAATTLSLALLHLLATGELPDQLPIKVVDAIDEASKSSSASPLYGAIITNPPYIRYEHLSADEKLRYSTYLGQDFHGRIDAYIPFVKFALSAVEAGGFVCMVLPETFLSAGNAAPLRKAISEDFEVRCLVDLSQVNVFDGVGAYSILLIVQKRPGGQRDQVPAQIAQVTEFVGPALQACLDGMLVDTPYYRVFEVDQSYFVAGEWTILSPDQMRIKSTLDKMPRLSQYADVKQGVVTGADKIFIRDRLDVNLRDMSIYMDFLPDREIGKYVLPTKTEQVVFYPYYRGQWLTEDEVTERFPETWKYLLAHREKLSERGPVRAGRTPWWRPESLRDARLIKGQKIVAPHVMLTPRFALDKSGNFAVSRSPIIVPKDGSTDPLMLKLLVGVLNSSICGWYIRTYAAKYSGGYNRIETKNLERVPVPNLAEISVASMNKVLDLVERLQAGKRSDGLEVELDSLVASLYGFGPSERKALFGLD